MLLLVVEVMLLLIFGIHTRRLQKTETSTRRQNSHLACLLARISATCPAAARLEVWHCEDIFIRHLIHVMNVLSGVHTVKERVKKKINTSIILVCGFALRLFSYAEGFQTWLFTLFSCPEAEFDLRNLNLQYSKHTYDHLDMSKSCHHIQLIICVVYLHTTQTSPSARLCRGSEKREFWQAGLKAAEDSLCFSLSRELLLFFFLFFLQPFTLHSIPE